ncbi:SAM-dependent methyltransferase [Achromobacter ruhlandii]|uniref:SAM-dependent methyltransferase n=1 Tax=Achromobacter ruhlandii TaxID=72557 RepID=UPI0007BEC786|nr:cyclopropane-fatty-acyl-phospholipid synthase family protein [Achromobacter ruhlandii]
MKPMTPSEHASIAASRRAGSLDRLLRQRLFASLGALDHGQLLIEDSLGSVTLGRGEPCVRLTVSDLGFYRLVAAQGSVGAGEAYGDGLWRCDDLVGLVRLLVRNRDTLDAMESGLARLAGWALRRWHAGNRNTRAGSRRNIAAHYDLGNPFFALFLSDDLMYSSALWADGDDTLEAASHRKLETICRKLELRPADRVVEIGSGWGGFAIHAARHYGCHVTTATLSREQHDLAIERVRAAGLQDRVSVVLRDYRDLQGQYDKLVSVEMIEAVGANFLEAYFAKVASLLEPGGRALIQAITIEDHRYRQALASVDFIKRHIFPGSFIPSIEAMLRAKTRACDLALVHLEDFGLSYARTLQAWRERFLVRLPEARAQGFDARFCRLWEFYLAYCEGGFRERSIGVAHLLLTHPQARATGARWVREGA